MIKFRASSVGNLLVGGNQITDRQRERLQELLDKKNNPPPLSDAKRTRLQELLVRKSDEAAKPLTAKQEAELNNLLSLRDNPAPLTAKQQTELEELIAKRDAKYEFGATALSYIRDCWLRNEYGYDEPIVTNEMLKGLLCEDDAIGVVTRQVPGPWREKNELSWENDWFTGTPDIVLDDAIEDVKCSWTIKSYVDVQHPSALYWAQGQVYMDLTGRDTFRLCHVLLPTPESIVMEEQKRFYFRFNCDEDDPHYIQCYRQLEAMHDVSMIPEDQRIKVFEFKREDMYLERLKKRVEQAQQFYNGLTL